MELILISSNKMKVILSEDEMKKYKLSSDGSIALISEKKQFRSLLDEIKKKSGFDTLEHSIYVELFESMRGGCEIFITKESSKNKSDSLLPSLTSMQKHSLESIITYKFSNAADLLAAAKRLNTQNSFISQLYADESDIFYLSLTFRQGYSDTEGYALIFLDEYGKKVSGQNLRTYLDEHGRKIIENNAIEVLSKL